MKSTPRQQTMWSAQLLIDFLKVASPLILSQVGFALPSLFSYSMIGSLGDITTLNVMGLSFTYFSLLNFVFVIATIEVTGAGCSKAFGAKNYQRMAGFFYKSLITIVAINVTYIISGWAVSFKVLRMIGVERAIAERSTAMILACSPGFFMHGINQLLQTYLMSQGIVRGLNLITMTSLLISLFGGRYFIITKGLRERGHAYSILSQEVVSFLISTTLLLKNGHGETLVLPSAKLIAEDGKVFLKKNFFSLLGVYGEYLFWEINTVILAASGSHEDIAGWVTFGMIAFLAYALALGLSNAFRTQLGQMIGSGRVEQARELSIIYYQYTFLVSIFLSTILLTFAPEITSLFLKDDRVLPMVISTVYMLAAYMFPFLALNTFFSVFRLLNMDAYFFKMSTIALPSLGLVLSLLLTGYWRMGFIGAVLSQGLCYGVFVVVFFVRIYLGTDWRVQVGRERKMKPLCKNIEVNTN